MMYCLTCLYDLRGLSENRCPECGRFFSPANPASYSSVPRREPLQKLLRQAADLLNDAVAGLQPADPMSVVRRQLSRLSTENAELRQQVATLAQALLDKGLVTPDELAASRRLLAPPDMPVVDDTEPPPAEEDEEPTPDLLELQRAVGAREPS